MNNTTTTPRPALTRPRQKRLLRTHKRAFILLFLYIPLVLIPWIITLILVHRPLTKPSWTHPSGFSLKDYKSAHAWARAIPILNAFAAVLAVTASSAVLAQAAVVVAQRRSGGQKMSVRELFGLADRVWCDFVGMSRLMVYGKGLAKWFALLGAVTVVFGKFEESVVWCGVIVC